jgi:hypothetical protein
MLAIDRRIRAQSLGNLYGAEIIGLLGSRASRNDERAAWQVIQQALRRALGYRRRPAALPGR